MGHASISATAKDLYTLPEADETALTALSAALTDVQRPGLANVMPRTSHTLGGLL
jgi:hypothetical protein